MVRRRSGERALLGALGPERGDLLLGPLRLLLPLAPAPAAAPLLLLVPRDVGELVVLGLLPAPLRRLRRGPLERAALGEAREREHGISSLMLLSIQPFHRERSGAASHTYWSASRLAVPCCEDLQLLDDASDTVTVAGCSR